MELRQTQTAIRFVGGVETKADPKTVPPVRLLGLENGIFTKALSIAKRHGYDALSTAVLGSVDPIENTRGLAARAGELVLFGDDRAYSYVDGAAAWDDAGAVQSVVASERTLVDSPAAQIAPDYAAAGGIGLCAWWDSRGGVWFALVEDDGGRITYPPTQASSTGTRPRAVRCGDKLALLWAEKTLGQLKVIMFDPAEPHAYDSTSFPAVLTTDLSTTTPTFDAAYVPASPTSAAALTWNSTAGIRVAWLDPTGVLGSPGNGGWPTAITLAGSTGMTYGPAIAVRPTSATSWQLAFGNASTVYAPRILSSSSLTRINNPSVALSGGDAVALAPRQAWNGTSYGTLVDVWVEDKNATPRLSTVTHLVVDNTTITTQATYRGACLASKAFTDGVDATDAGEMSHSYVTLIHDVPLFGVYLTMRNDGIVVARSLPGIAGDAVASTQHLPSVIADGNRRYRWSATYKEQLEGLNADQFTNDGIRQITLDFGSSESHQTATFGRCIYMAGACPQLYDGQGWVEAGFHYAPDWETSETLHTNSTDGAASLTVGTRNYVFSYEFTLATGEIVRGPVSKPYTVTISGAHTKTTLSIPTLRITRMHDTVDGRARASIAVWRTVDGDATTYYRVSGTQAAPVEGGSVGSGLNAYVSNSITADSASFQDGMSDAVLIAKEPLYTNGGIPSNDPIAGSSLVAGGKGRLFVGDPSDGNLVLFSQERDEGYAVEFTPELRIQLDPYGGAITGIGVLDDLVVLFKRGAIYAVAGPGPRANPAAGGGGDGFTAPGLITSDVGCIAQRSIVTTPVGLMFQSAKGIYLLSRSREVTYVGAPVERYNDQTITRATLVDDTTQVRFLTSSGRTLLYDYFFQQWSTWTNHEGVDAAVVDGVYHYLRNDGRVFREDASSYDDAGVRIPLVVETAWIRFQEQLQGRQAFWHLLLLGEWKSAHAIRLQYALDYTVDGNWSEPIEIDATSMGGSNFGDGNFGDGNFGGTPHDPYQWRWHIGEKGQAIRFRISDSEEVGVYGAGFELTEGLLTGGVMSPATRPFPNNRTA